MCLFKWERTQNLFFRGIKTLHVGNKGRIKWQMCLAFFSHVAGRYKTCEINKMKMLLLHKLLGGGGCQWWWLNNIFWREEELFSRGISKKLVQSYAQIRHETPPPNNQAILLYNSSFDNSSLSLSRLIIIIISPFHRVSFFPVFVSNIFSPLSLLLISNSYYNPLHGIAKTNPSS